VFVGVADLSVLDPVVSGNRPTRNYAYLVFDTLYGLDTAWNVQPQMVSGHQVDPGGLDWTLKLREGLRFHDKEPVLARDVVASIRRFAPRVAQVVAGNDAALEARARQIDELARQGRYPSGPFVPAVSYAFAAFERRDFSAAIDALEPIAGELERIGGSRAQLDLVEFTLVKAYLSADRLDDARRMLSVRRPSPSGTPVAGLKAVH
jgi:hypothetical protein